MRQVGIFGKRKSGKSALMYALMNHKIINATKYSAMEIGGVGKIMLVDTVGVDAESSSSAEKSAESIEVALMLISNESFELELAWLTKLKKRGAAVIAVITQSDKFADGGQSLAAAVKEVSALDTVCVSAKTGAGIDELGNQIILKLSEERRESR